ncbi:MAG: radical SAM protein [Chloroflexaceae bacterium]|nr:radical SAM protein [Chloroflexaceae bacterium]
MVAINVAEICPQTRVLGPGRRFVIWVQGCCFHCPGCIAPDWIPRQPATLIEAEDLADWILSVPDLDGVTVSGGEPMLQAAALSELLTHLRQKRDFSLICYSGFTLEQLQAQGDRNSDRLLSLLDVLIDGLYVEGLNDGRGWRGSSNQRIHFLTPRHAQDAAAFSHRPRQVEVHLRRDSALLVGIPPRAVSQALHRAIADS